MEETISISNMFNIFKKRWKLIVLLTCVTAMIGGVISYFVLKPVYQASTQILVNQKDSRNPLDMGQVQTNLGLINTYSVIIKSPAILDKVKENFDLSQSVIEINNQEDSQIFSLTVEDRNATTAVENANAVSETFQKEIPNIMNIDNVSILAKAENAVPVNANPILNIAIALVIGLMVGIGLSLLLEYMDNTIKDDQDVEAQLGLPLLGTIQKFSDTHKNAKKKQVS